MRLLISAKLSPSYTTSLLGWTIHSSLLFNWDVFLTDLSKFLSRLFSELKNSVFDIISSSSLNSVQTALEIGILSWSVFSKWTWVNPVCRWILTQILLSYFLDNLTFVTSLSSDSSDHPWSAARSLTSQEQYFGFVISGKKWKITAWKSHL